MSDYPVILKGLVFGDFQPERETEPRVILNRHITLPFAPWVGLIIDWNKMMPVFIQSVLWNQDGRYFECNVSFGYEDGSEVVSETRMKSEGWIDE
jgi:hypothetical protein